MAITKPPVLPAWADAGDKVQPSNAELSVGWPVSSTPPSRQRFNWVLNYVANAVRYFSRRGLVDYDAAETYMTGDRIIGDDGKTYRSLIDNNTAQTPSTSPTKWERWGFSLSDLGANAQTQPYTAFTTTGATGAFVLTPSPAIAAYAANQRFRVKFHAVGNGADNMNISALGNKSLKQYDNTGAKVAAVIAANQLVDIEYDGVDLVLLDPLPPVSAQGNFQGLNSTNVSATLALSDLGKLYAFYGSTAAQILTLPAIASVSVGKNAIIVNQASVAVTVKGNASENISSNTAGAGQTLSNTIILNPGDSITLSSNGTNQWNAVGFTSSGQFPNSKAGNGYQKLPSGLIIQWGNAALPGSGAFTVTHPVAFPTANIHANFIVTANNGSGNTAQTVTSLGLTSTSFTNNSGAACTAYWCAIGY